MDKKEIVKEYVRFTSDPIYAIFTYFYTYDKEAKEKRLFAAGYPVAYQAKLKAFILKVIDVIIKGRKVFRFPDFHNLKSRQTYQSWTMAAIETWCYLCLDNFAALITTDGDSDLDNANYYDYNTKLGKIGYITINLPLHLRPAEKDLLRSHNSITYPMRNASIKGDSSMFPGMGPQLDLHDGDEFAAQRFPNVKLASMREGIKGANVLNSTPKGKLNPFYDIWKMRQDEPDNSSFNLETWHWKEKMNANEWDKFMKDALARYGGDKAMMGQELELSFDGIATKGRVFTSFVSSRDVVDIKPGSFKLGISCDAWDFGVGAPTVVVLFTLRDKDIIALDGRHQSGTSPQQFAVEYKKMCAEWGIPFHVIKHIGDPSGASNPRESADYDSSFELFRKEGIYIIGGNPRKLEGIQVINGEFYSERLKVNKRLSYLIDGLNTAVFPTDKQSGDVTKEEYKAEHPLIDYLDTFKYGVRYMVSMTHPTKAIQDRSMPISTGSSRPQED